jgi:uncharacterized protein YecE (DUF72 family)
MKILIGTSGFSYPAWKGTFYPEKIPQKDMLSFYAGKLPTVEINNTFYRLPAASMLEGWAGQVPAHFRFAVKAPQRITHQQRLKESADTVKYLFEVIGVLGERLGPVLFQLPPNMKRDVPRLRDFLALLPKDRRVAFEFRNEGWFTDEVYALLREHGVALGIAESEQIEPPVLATTDWGYLRLRREDYVDADVARWADQIRAQPWKQAFVYFKHEDAGIGPKLAARLIELLAK